MVQVHGFKNGKYQIFETERGVKLDFHGADADKFEQVNPPERPTKVVGFSLTLKDLETFFPGFTEKLTNTRELKERSDVNNNYETYSTLRDAIDAAIDANPDADPIEALTDTLADYVTENETHQSLIRCVVQKLNIHAPDAGHEEEEEADAKPILVAARRIQ